MMHSEHLLSFSQVAPVTCAAILLLPLLWFLLFSRRSAHHRLPPGPKGIPLLGNAFQMPMDYQERTFLAWGKTFGDIVHARLLRTSIIVVNSWQVARDLMDKRSANYSDRPRFTLLGELPHRQSLGLGDTLPLIPYGDRFRKYRRWFHDAFLAQGVLASYHPLISREIHNMLKSLVIKPDAYATHFFRYAAATVIEISYGHRVTSDNDEYVAISENAMHAAATTGSEQGLIVHPVKYYPTWLPGSGFKIKLLETRVLLQKMLDTQYNIVKNALRSGGIKNASFAANLLEAHYRNGVLPPEDDVDIRGASGTLYAASTESMVSVMRTFILAMVLHPEVFKKAQEEIDSIVGPDRLPDWEDRDSLPYLNCVLKEVLRWNVPVPLAVPHVATRDDVYRNYKIPAGAMVIGNIWGMSQDEEVYEEPRKFLPERFMKIDPDSTTDPKNFVFGFGRRICPGKEFADLSLFKFMACMIATMDIRKARDANGQEITPSEEFTTGFARRPLDFPCVIVARHQKAMRLILEAETD
ncbi:cytochrome P450 monooxygenase [Cristinia sonorae]|uniref:Cytochrome P450 monooxygenase n=1 Tax=Cristinia sonorae TaxID=1940300 RepID=A0A8K0UJJ4_9AGAR|nr:cytochrome P450 monooxygenase [Cristinia sonorae]